MKTLFFILALFILGCVHNQSAFDTVQLSFREKNVVRSDAPSPSLTPSPSPEPSPILPEKTSSLSSVETAPVFEPAPSLPENEKLPPVKSIEPNPLPEKKLEAISFRDVDALPEEIQDAVRLAQGNYRVTKTIRISEKGTLWLLPGTKIVFEEAGIFCKGKLQALGNGEDPIVLEGPDGWDNITLWGAQAVGILEYCEIRHGLGMEVEILEEQDAVLKKGAITRGGAILYANGAYGHIKNCIIKKNFSQAAVALIHTKDILVEGCEIGENDENGMVVIDSQCEVVENQFLQNRKSGLLLMGKSSPPLRKNFFRANRAGITLLGIAAPSIIENTFSVNSVGIECQSVSAGMVSKNTFERNQVAGIICIERSRPKIEENILEQNRITGILISNHAAPEVRNNTLRHNPKNAFLILEKAAPEIVGNTITDSVCAFVIAPSVSLFIDKNKIERCQKERDVPKREDFTETK